MARFQQDKDVRALGEALASLRRACGLSQAEAGARIGMTSQGWGLYEAGRRPGLFRPDVQKRLTEALDASPEALALTVARETAGGATAAALHIAGVESGSRAYDAGPRSTAAVPDRRERLQVSNDDLAPWAASGVTLEVDFGRWPRRDQGCVVDLADGTRLIRLYERADADGLHLRGGPNGLADEQRVLRSQVRRVGAVIARLDP